MASTSEGAPERLRGLPALYRRYIGEPEREIDIYAGFALFFGGIAFGVIGLGLYLWSTGLSATAPGYWQLREVAITLASAGLPAFVLSVVVLLPVDRRAVYAGLVGTAVCVCALGVFIAAYPANWNVRAGTDYSIYGVTVYAGGLALLVASTGTALVAQYLQRMRSAPAGAAPADGAADADGDPTTPPGATSGDGSGSSVTQQDVEQDIEEALSSAELTWGGVTKRETKRLRIETDTPEIENTNVDDASATTTTTRSEGVDDAVAGLRRLQGGERMEASGDGVDEQTAALTELRERQAADETPMPDEGSDGVVSRLRERFFG